MVNAIACVNHASRAAVFECRECTTHVCSECAKHTWTRKGFIDECPKCQVEMRSLDAVVEKLEAAASAPPEGVAGFVSRFPEFLAFPINKSVLLMVIGLSVLTVPLYWAAGHNISPILGLMALFFAHALECSMYFRFVSQTAFGIRDIRSPDLTDVQEDLFAPLLRYIVALLPILVAAAWWGQQQLNSFVFGILLFSFNIPAVLASKGPAVLFVAGVLILPLTTIVAAISKSAIAVLNPAVWVSSLRVLGPSYLVACAAYYAVMAFEYFALVPVALELNVQHSIPVVTSMATAIVGYLTMSLRARILGGLCEPYYGD